MAAEAETIKQIIRYQLLAAPAVTALVSGRIYGGHFQDPLDQSPTYPLIILEWIGAGELQYARAFQKMRMDIWCYDRVSSASALHLYGQVQDALQAQLLSVDGITQKGYMREVVRPTEGFNNAVRAYYARGEFWCMATAMPVDP